MPVLRRQLLSVMFAVLTLFTAVPSALSQDSPLDAAAEKIADAVSQAKIRDVIVFDFSGPDRKITPLGQKLASQFSAALGKSAAKLRVEDRSQIPGALQAKSYPLDFVDWGELAHSFAQDIQVESFVMGELSVRGDQLNVVISSYRSDTGKNITSTQIAWPVTGDDESMMTENLADVSLPHDLAPYPNSGAKGYRTPACLYCPRAEYTPESRARRISGMVQLVGIVGEDGQFSDIRVLKPLPYGLSAAAVKAVSSWRLKPAIGPDGKPAAVRQLVEVTFQLY